MTTFTYSGYIATFRANGSVSKVTEATMDVVADGADATFRYSRTYTNGEPDAYIYIQSELLTLRVDDENIPLYSIAGLHAETEQLAWSGGVSNVLSVELGDGTTFVTQISGDSIPEFDTAADMNAFLSSVHRAQLLNWGFYGPDMDIPLSRVGSPTISEHDVITGDKFGNILAGGKGKDMIFGAGGKDQISGGGGNDTLIGGGGNDQLRGGKGNDIFVFQNQGGIDRVMDFEVFNRREKLDLSAVDEIAGYRDLVNNHLTFRNGNTVIDDGDGSKIVLVGIDVDDLARGDFIF